MKTLTVFLLPLLLIVAACRDSAVVPADNDGIAYGVTPGFRAPDIAQNDTAGRQASLRQFRGKIVLLDFWATWCSPCIREIPHLKSLWAKHQGDEFMIVSVSLDYSLREWRDFIRTSELGWTHITDGRNIHNEAVGRYGIDAIPRTYLLDRRGVIIGVDLQGANLDTAIAQALWQ